MHILSRELKKAKRKNPEIVKGIINTTHPERVTVLSSQGFFMRLHIPTFSGKKKEQKGYTSWLQRKDSAHGRARWLQVTLCVFSHKHQFCTAMLRDLRGITPFLSISRSSVCKNVDSNNCSTGASLGLINTCVRPSDKRTAVITQFQLLLA